MKLRLFFATILVPVDYIMLAVAGFTAYFLRFESGFVEIRPAVSVIPYDWYFLLSFTVPLAWLAIFAISGLYKIEERKFFDDIPKIIFACSTGIMFVIALIFFNREFFASRFIILAVWILAIIFVSLGRIAVNFIYYILRRQGRGMLRVAIIGGGRAGEAIRKEFISNPVLGRKVISGFPYFDNMAKCALHNLKSQGALDEVIYTGVPDTETQSELYKFCEENDLSYTRMVSAAKRGGNFKGYSFEGRSPIKPTAIKPLRIN